MNKKQQDNIIDEYTSKIQVLLTELDNKLEVPIILKLYWGDVTFNGVEHEGLKVLIEVIEDE